MKKACVLGAVLAAMAACANENPRTSSEDANEQAAQPASTSRHVERAHVATPLDAGATEDAAAPAPEQDAAPTEPALDAASVPGLAWFATCGYPVCPVPPDGEPPAASTCASEGAPCANRGETCGDGKFTCGSVMVCDDHDPKRGGCPVSSAKFKDAVRYLSDADLERLRDETLATRLTTYRYTGDGTRHLGFIVEDQPESMSVDRGHDRVDLYGYLSMVVATLQMQEKEIRELKAQCRKP
jgi:hypothetical protein